jgi:small subunit ribosomal protein S13
MARIAGVDLPREKRVEVGLTAIFGIGRATALTVLERTGIAGATRVRDLSDAEVARLPVRGQRTRNNALTKKWPRRTIAGKKNAVLKK